MPAFESAQDVYARNLLSHRGYPLWTPEPDPELPTLYREEGLQIGDVGVVVPSLGSFDVFFNMCLPREHELHLENGVPENFTHIPLKNKDVRVTSDVEPGGCVISSPSAKRIIDSPPDVVKLMSEYQFKLSSSEGALLILPQGAESRVLSNVLPFIEKAKRDAFHWYKFARQVLGRNIGDDALYLITGFYKAHCWSLASFRGSDDSTDTSSSANFVRIADHEDSGIGATYTWFTTGPVDKRVGPKYNPINANQCVFITGLKIAIRHEKLRKSVAVQVDTPSINPGNLEFSQVVDDSSWMAGIWDILTGVFGTVNTSQRTSDSGDSDKNIAVYNVPEVPQPFHPSDIINRYLLAKEPTAAIAITHDSDWVHLIENRNGLLRFEDLLKQDYLEKMLAEKFRLVSADGGVHLQRKMDGNIGSDEPDVTPHEHVQLRSSEIGSNEMESILATLRHINESSSASNGLPFKKLKEEIKPIVMPSPQELAAAKKRVQYKEGYFHFAVAGISGSGKSSLVNAFRGLRSRDAGAAAVGITETTLEMTRYPDPRPQRYIWYDIPGAGTITCPDWQYFNSQGLYVFDCILILFDNRFTMTDIAILANCRRFKIPTYIVRSKADQHIQNIMKEMEGYSDEEDEDPERRNKRYNEARGHFIEQTRKSVKANLEYANLPDQQVYIVSEAMLCAISRDKKPKGTIDEVELLGDLYSEAHDRHARSDKRGIYILC